MFKLRRTQTANTTSEREPDSSAPTEVVPEVPDPSSEARSNAASDQSQPADDEQSNPAEPIVEPCPGAPLFNAEWYAGGQPLSEVEAWEDYVATGSREARAPAPLFSPAWYREAYPDVALARIEPLVHYLAHGWREGRNPSPAVSTEHLLASEGDLPADAAADPLTRALQRARHAPVSVHPGLPALNPWHRDVAIIMVYRRDRAALDLALWALTQDLTAPPRTLYLIDDGEPEARADLDSAAVRLSSPHLLIRRLSEPDARGEVALWNAGIWAARQAKRHSHMLLLEQTVVLPVGHIERLVDLWAPIAVPVLNRAATEQAIPIDFDIYKSANPLQCISKFVAERQATIAGAVQATGAVAPACALLMSGVFEVAGLSDAGGMDLNTALRDMVTGLQNRGLELPLVARHLYAHRLERSPLVIGAAAKEAGERTKSRLAGVDNAEVPLPAALASAAADRRAIYAWTRTSHALLAAHAARCQGAMSEETSLLVAYGDQPKAPHAQEPVAYRAAYRAVQQRLWLELIARDHTRLQSALAMQPIAAALASLFEDTRPCLVLTMDTDPETGDERDGYVQRVIAIDRALAGRARLYLKMVQSRKSSPALRRLTAGIWRLEIAHGCDLGEAVLAAVLKLGAPVYSQSLVGIDPPVVRKLLPERRGPLLMDMHGAVPEEFVLYENYFLAQKYSGYEAWAAVHADAMVCVTEAMAAHLCKKLGLPGERMIVCPIFMHADHGRPSVRSYNRRPRAIYAGGTQRWQQIPSLAELVAATQAEVDWVLLTPDVEGMHAALLEARADANAGGIGVRAASQSEVFASYQSCDFGLLLREDSVVNRVACPTKLVEYLRFGVIPVLDFVEIGDFAAHGLEYVTREAFLTGNLPSVGERARMAAANRTVLERFRTQSRDGQRHIAAAVADPPRQALSAISSMRQEVCA